jgi:hypothetical protein
MPDVADTGRICRQRLGDVFIGQMFNQGTMRLVL